MAALRKQYEENNYENKDADKEITFNNHSSDDVFLKTKTHSASIFTSFVLERIFSVKQCSKSTVLKFIA